MEAMRAERRHEVVADMDGQAGLVSIKKICGFNFLLEKEKRVSSLFLFLFLFSS